MKHWQEACSLFERLAELHRAGRSAALATVVHIAGSAYRRPGARMLIEADGRMSGGVSGGCLEADVREVALAALEHNTPRLLHYDTGDDDQVVWGLGLGCNGTTEILVQPLPPGAEAQPLQAVRELLGGDRSFAVATMIDGGAAGRILVRGPDGSWIGSSGEAGLDRAIDAALTEQLEHGGSRLREAGGARIFAELFSPPPHLILCGAGDDSVPLARLAADAGFRLAVVDHRPAYLTAERFPRARLHRARPEEGVKELPLGPHTMVLLKMHSLAQDRGWLENFLATDVRYLGILGPRDRTDRMLDELGAKQQERIYGPVGLDLGAEGPEQVALSIVAELLAVWSGGSCRSLREKGAPIHS